MISKDEISKFSFKNNDVDIFTLLKEKIPCLDYSLRVLIFNIDHQWMSAKVLKKLLNLRWINVSESDDKNELIYTHLKKYDYEFKKYNIFPESCKSCNNRFSNLNNEKKCKTLSYNKL